jgi:hypothetical protein
MSLCAECDGIGSLSLGHPLDPNAGVVECEACEGTGRRCDDCRESLPLSFADDASLCRDCQNAADEEERDESEERERLLTVARQARDSRLSMEARQVAGGLLAVLVPRYFGGEQ